jgi:hypothetical protein
MDFKLEVYYVEGPEHCWFNRSIYLSQKTLAGLLCGESRMWLAVSVIKFKYTEEDKNSNCNTEHTNKILEGPITVIRQCEQR